MRKRQRLQRFETMTNSATSSSSTTTQRTNDSNAITVESARQVLEGRDSLEFLQLNVERQSLSQMENFANIVRLVTEFMESRSDSNIGDKSESINPRESLKFCSLVKMRFFRFPFFLLKQLSSPFFTDELQQFQHCR
jgi:hypothetical protein